MTRTYRPRRKRWDLSEHHWHALRAITTTEGVETVAKFPGHARRQAEMIYHLASCSPIVSTAVVGLDEPAHTISDCAALAIAADLFDSEAERVDAEIKSGLDEPVKLRFVN